MRAVMAVAPIKVLLVVVVVVVVVVAMVGVRLLLLWSECVEYYSRPPVQY